MNITLGKIIDEPAPPKDAVHVAVAQVLATTELRPGQHVGAQDGKAYLNTTHCGIVDPFLREPVKIGEYFWLFLYPNTVEGLRHDWDHPAFAEEEREDSPDSDWDSGCRNC